MGLKHNQPKIRNNLNFKQYLYKKKLSNKIVKTVAKVIFTRVNPIVKYNTLTIKR